MDTGSVHAVSSSAVEGVPGSSPKAMSSVNDRLEESLSDEEVRRAVGGALDRLELHLACCSEKLVNLNILMMYVATKESEFEAFTSKERDSLVILAEDALQFDILSSIFYSEVREMTNFIGNVQTKINNVHEMISSHKHLRDVITTIEGKLHDAEASLKQSREQVSELMMQSIRFQRIILDTAAVEDGDFCNATANLRMRTSERECLRMLEKSLARELNVEKQLIECMQALDWKKLKLLASQRKLLSAEEQSANIYAQFIEADSASAVLMGISKELIGQLQSCQFKMNNALCRETELNSKLQDCMQVVQKLESKEVVLQELVEKSNLEALAFKEKINSLEEQIKESEITRLNGDASSECIDKQHEFKSLEELLVIAESRAEKSEAECKLLSVTNKELNEELDCLKGSGVSHEKIDSLEKQLRETDIQLQQAMACIDASEERESVLNNSIEDMEILIKSLTSNASLADAQTENAEAMSNVPEEPHEELTKDLDLLKAYNILNEKVDSLEKQLKETDIQLQEATASVEASQEKQSMLYSSINDLEILIEKLKSKVSEADARADSAEDKCIILSESHAELSEELSFLRGKVESLEASLIQAEETNLAAAEDINIRTKVVADLVMQLAVERQRLQKQIAFFTVDKRAPVVKIKMTNMASVNTMNHEVGETENRDFSSERNDRNTSGTTEVGKSAGDVIDTESSPASEELNSKVETVQTIDATWLGFKTLFFATLVAFLALLAACSFSPETCSFLYK